MFSTVSSPGDRTQPIRQRRKGPPTATYCDQLEWLLFGTAAGHGMLEQL